MFKNLEIYVMFHCCNNPGKNWLSYCKVPYPTLTLQRNGKNV